MPSQFLTKQTVKCIYTKTNWVFEGKISNLPKYNILYTVREILNDKVILEEIPDMIFTTSAFTELELDLTFAQKVIDSL